MITVDQGKVYGFFIMAKDFAKAFYNSKAWAACRSAYISERRLIDGGMCESCGKEPGYIVHHIEPLTAANINNPEVALNHDNLRYDCKECHDREDVHAFVKVKQTLCAFGADGQPIPPHSEIERQNAKDRAGASASTDDACIRGVGKKQN